MVVNVFTDHNGIIHQHPQNDDHPHQNQGVHGITLEIDEGNPAKHSDGNANGGDDGRPPI